MSRSEERAARSGAETVVWRPPTRGRDPLTFEIMHNVKGEHPKLSDRLQAKSEALRKLEMDLERKRALRLLQSAFEQKSYETG